MKKLFILIACLVLMPTAFADDISLRDDYYVSSPRIYNDDELIHTIDRGATYDDLNIKVSVERNSESSKKINATCVAATFDGDRMVGLSIDKDVATDNVADMKVGLNDNLIKTNSKVKVYVWDENMNPLCDVQEIDMASGVDDVYTTDMEVVRQRIIDASNLYSTSANPQSYLNKLGSDGKFTDIDYSYTSVMSTWEPSQVFPRVNTMAQAYFSVGNSWYHNATLKKAIDSVLNDWANNKYTSVNWWFNQISVPQSLSVTLLYPFDESEPYLDTLKDVARNGLPSVDESKIHKSSDTGGNLTDKLQIAIKIAAAIRDEDIMKNTVSYLLNNELSIFSSDNKGEGIMADYTFHQHNSFFYDGSYGNVFTTGVNKLFGYLKDTVYMVSDDAVNTYSSYIVNGHSWFFKNSMSDYNCFGRAISRKSGVSSTIKTDSAGAVAILEDLPCIKNRVALEELKSNRLSGTDNSTTAARHFFKSDMTVMQRPDLYIGVRNSSSRNINTEYMNSENSKGMYISDGNTTLMRTGSEYQGIFAVWDWSRIPGTTTEYHSPVPTMGTTYQYGADTFVGGTDDGVNAVSCMNYARQGVTARKSYFMFGDAMMALGADITGTTASTEVDTTVNQCKQSGTTTYNNGSDHSVYTTNKTAINNVNWVMQGGIGYYFPNKENLNLEVASKSGSWYNINTSQSSSTVTANIFTLYKSHGVKPSDDTYEYTVLPVDSTTEMKSYASDPYLVTVANDELAQAVWSKNDASLGIVFWCGATAKDSTSYANYGASTYQREVSVPSSVSGLESDLTIKALRDPCCVIVKQTEDDMELYVSNPKNSTLDGTYIGINRKLKGEGTTYDGTMTKVYVPFAQGEYKGSTTKVTLKFE